jgi:hypothetical protein
VKIAPAAKPFNGIRSRFCRRALNSLTDRKLLSQLGVDDGNGSTMMKPVIAWNDAGDRYSRAECIGFVNQQTKFF